MADRSLYFVFLGTLFFHSSRSSILNHTHQLTYFKTFDSDIATYPESCPPSTNKYDKLGTTELI